MRNLKECNGAYKSLIGECMFKLAMNYAVINKYWNKTKYIGIFGQYLNREQMEFLNDYWHSIDAIEVNFRIGEKKIILYEIKTKNVYKKKLNFKPKIIHSKVLLYKKAIKLGFEVKLAYICLHNDWNFSIEFFNLSKTDYRIEIPEQYGRENLQDFI